MDTAWIVGNVIALSLGAFLARSSPSHVKAFLKVLDWPVFAPSAVQISYAECSTLDPFAWQLMTSILNLNAPLNVMRSTHEHSSL